MCLLTTSCAGLKISDTEWCGDEGPIGASCFHTNTTATRDVSKTEWDLERFGMICGKASAFAELKDDLLKLCNETRSCTYEQLKMLRQLGENLSLISGENHVN